ncbi:YqgE/AlgH family protein [Aeromicrobium sp. CF3.5]|uniref:YqgE/AlgH family protein n=1 Tax=Aeromicrobium sp. CF3.5 TaxID=3373078 RepID=UPI003EE53049
METLSGHLLVATPAIDDGPFWRSVVFVLDHDDDGALGVIVNRPLDSDVDDVLPQWADLLDAPVCFFDGGPVAEDVVLAVALVEDTSVAAQLPTWRSVAGRVGLIDLTGPPPEPGQVSGLRVFAGYAGWGPGQLETEIDHEAWVVVAARDADLVSPQPANLWHDVLRRQEGDLRFWATLPDDPTAN